jgi:transcriptional regulator with XRE-family HTH domain
MTGICPIGIIQSSGFIPGATWRDGKGDSNNARMTFAHFKNWRLHRKMTQEQAAEVSGLSQGTIARLETGAREFREHHLEKLARAYQCEMWELIGRDPLADNTNIVFDILDRIPPESREQAMRTLASFAKPKKSAAKTQG